ncbi:hypothetical protein DIPPA_21714 [Diplonema papillatum]|nr:hypothetical protein DIPPA_21714 [Diplonema papillatum]
MMAQANVEAEMEEVVVLEQDDSDYVSSVNSDGSEAGDVLSLDDTEVAAAAIQDEGAAPEEREDENEMDDEGSEAAEKEESNEADDANAEEEPAVPPAKKARLEAVRSGRNRARRDFTFKSKTKLVNKLDTLRAELSTANAALAESKRKTPRALNGLSMKQLREWASSTIDSGATRVHIMAQVESFRDQLARVKEANQRVSGRRVRKGVSRFALLEAALKGFTAARRSDHSRVTAAGLQAQGEKFLTEDAEIGADAGSRTKLSKVYIRKLMRRNKLVVKGIVKQTNKTDAELAAKCQTIHEFLFRVAPHCDAILNFDEIPASLAGTMGKISTITHQADKDVKLNFDPNSSKRCATVIAIACTKKDGVEVEIPPIVLLKGQPVQRRVLDVKYDAGAFVIWTPCGVITKKAMIEAVLPHLVRHLAPHSVRPLIIMDSASSHTSDEVITAFHAASMYTAIEG